MSYSVKGTAELLGVDYASVYRLLKRELLLKFVRPENKNESNSKAEDHLRISLPSRIVSRA
jgi:hypothetical protein